MLTRWKCYKCNGIGRILADADTIVSCDKCVDGFIELDTRRPINEPIQDLDGCD